MISRWLAGFLFVVGGLLSTSSATAEAPAADAPAPGRLQAAVQGFVDRQELAGAVMLVSDARKTLAIETVGWADVAAKRPMRPDTLFWIASQSKPITGAALMMLVDDGKVRLDDPVEKHLPEFRGLMVVAERDAERLVLRRPKRPITVRHVLSHVSGMPFKSPLEEPTLDRFPLAARVRSYAMTPLDFDPETKYQYSNAGINTAARIVEVVAGVPFEKFLEDRLCRPLGMVDTTFWPTEEQVARLAKAYKPGDDAQRLVETTIAQLKYPLADRAERFPMPAGGLFSTAQDLARFYRMLLGDGELDGVRVLSADSVRQLVTRQTPADLRDSYGLGFAVGDRWFGHGGAYATNTTAHVDRGLILAWLVQHAGFPGEGGKAHETFRRAAFEAFAPAP